ncbi:hypothetical protein [Ruminococcus champanellensis]
MAVNLLGANALTLLRPYFQQVNDVKKHQYHKRQQAIWQVFFQWDLHGCSFTPLKLRSACCISTIISNQWYACQDVPLRRRVALKTAGACIDKRYILYYNKKSWTASVERQLPLNVSTLSGVPIWSAMQ